MGTIGKGLHILRAWGRSHGSLLHAWLDPLVHRAGGSLVPLGDYRIRRNSLAISGGTAMGTGGNRHSLDRFFLDFDGARNLVCREAHRLRSTPTACCGLEVHPCITA